MPELGVEKSHQNGTQTEPKTEPHESDPCVESSDVKPIRKSEFFERYVDEISDRTGLNRNGVFYVSGIVFVVFVLLVTVIALGAAWPRVPHKWRFPVCREAACLRAAAQISDSMDNSKSPCGDLWGSMCGGWLKNNPLPSNHGLWDPKHQIADKVAAELRDVVATLPLPLHTGTVEWKLKYFYDACMDVDNIKLEGARPLTNIISELGGWYILHDWNEEDFDSKELLKQLQIKYGVNPYFRISVEPDPHTSGINTIRISPSGLGLPDKSYYYADEKDPIQMAYKDFIRDIILYLDSPRFEATKFANDMFSYEKRIAEVTPNRNHLQNPIDTYNAMSITELKNAIGLINFYDILQAMYPESNISENTEVIVTSMEYLNEISQIISTTDRRTMNGYLILTLVRKYVPYLSDKFTTALDTFHSELFGIKESLPRWKMCTNLVKEHMSLAIEVLTGKLKPIENKTKKIVNETFNSILNVVKTRIEDYDDTAMLYQHLKSKLHALNLQIGLPDSTNDDAYLKNHYAKLKIIKTNIFESVKNAIAFEKKIDEKLLLNSIPNAGRIKYALTDPPKVTYSPSDGAIIVPRSLLTAPVFENEFPSAIIYGRLGVEIAEAVVSSILPYGSLWTADKKILSPFHMTVNESIRTVQRSTKCLAKYLAGFNYSHSETALKTLKHLSAVNVANEALLSSLNEDEHVHQPSLEEYEDSSLFFIVYSQTQCSVATRQYKIYKNLVDFDLPRQLMLHLAWDQLREFPKSFDCKHSTELQCSGIF